jgi:hypothetical protein
MRQMHDLMTARPSSLFMMLDFDRLPDDLVHASHLGRADLSALKPNTMLSADSMLCYC